MLQRQNAFKSAWGFEYKNIKVWNARKASELYEGVVKSDPQTDFMENLKCSVIVCLGQIYTGNRCFCMY